MVDDLTALRLQLDWGADEALGDAPLDRSTLLPPPRAVNSRPAAPAILPRTPRAVAPRSQPKSETLEQLAAELDAFEGCALRLSATTTVRPDGNPRAPLLVVGEAPDSEDDRSGRAFSGAPGALLDRVMATAGLDRTGMLLTTLIPWRPPGGRKPTEGEIQACMPFLHRLIAIVRPERMVLLGSLPLKSLSSMVESTRRRRGSWVDVNIPLVEPAISSLPLPPLDQWLTSPITKQRLWSDLITLQKAIETS